MSESHRTTAEQILAGRYRLVQPISRGGMAQVWEAFDEVLARPVAVKVLHAHLAEDEAFLERFRREAIAAARLVHPNVVAIFDTGIDNGTAYIVMELVRGSSLQELLQRRGTLGPNQAIDIAAQVAEALHYAHEAGLVHRDVKPANVLITGDQRVKVADFGIARIRSGRTADDLTQPGAIMGTAKYLAPEQVQGTRADRRSDVYALGVLLYEMLCGRPPFTGDTDMTIALQHLKDEPLRPRQLRAGIPRPLEAVVVRAMAKDPDARYQTASELCTALRSIDVADDDATVSVVRDPTPPGGIVPSFRQSERSWLVPAGLILLVAAVLAVVGVLFGHTDAGRRLLDAAGKSKAGSTGPSVQVAIASASAFDPAGDGSEHGPEAHLAVDGNPTTAWTTQTYRGPRFGGLRKDGVGLILSVEGGRHRLGRLRVSSPTQGWSASVFVADQPGATVAEWGSPVVTRGGIDGSATFDLRGRRGGALLLWITDTGRTDGEFRTAISEARVTR